MRALQPFRQLRASLTAIGNAPCMTCPHMASCAEQHLACQDFRDYVTHGAVIPTQELVARRLRGEQRGPRVPTAAIFDLIYNGDEDHEMPN